MTADDETWRAERAVIDAALAAVATYRGSPMNRDTNQAMFDVLTARVDCLDALVKRDAEWVWVKRLWRDVRQGDIIRPVGMPAHAARVEAIERHTRTVRRVTLLPGCDDTTAVRDPFTRDVSNPDGAIEIHLTRGEVAAIEALGGWSARMGVIWDEG